MRFSLCVLVLAATAAQAVVRAQPPGGDDDKRIFGIIPNYRTVPTVGDYQPIAAGAKFAIAKDDALDRGTFVLAAIFAGHAQLTGATPEFGGGLPAYAKYYGGSLAGIANVYYPGKHSLSSNLTKLALQVAVDAAANVVKEFAPDLSRR